MLTYEMKQPTLVEPVNINDDPKFTVKLYNPSFEEFFVYFINVSNASPKNKISLSNWSIAIVLTGNVIMIKEANGEKIEMKQYSTWLLESDEYTILANDGVSEIYITIEGAV